MANCHTMFNLGPLKNEGDDYSPLPEQQSSRLDVGLLQHSNHSGIIAGRARLDPQRVMSNCASLQALLVTWRTQKSSLLPRSK